MVKLIGADNRRLRPSSYSFGSSRIVCRIGIALLTSVVSIVYATIVFGRASEIRIDIPLSIADAQMRWPAAANIFQQLPGAHAFSATIGSVSIIRIEHPKTCYLGNCLTHVGLLPNQNTNISTTLFATNKVFVPDTAGTAFPDMGSLIFDCDMRDEPCKAEVVVSKRFFAVVRNDLRPRQ